MTDYLISIAETKNIDLFRRNINAAFMAIASGYGDELPDPAGSADGRLFYIGSQAYQLREGVWVSL